MGSQNHSGMHSSGVQAKKRGIVDGYSRAWKLARTTRRRTEAGVRRATGERETDARGRLGVVSALRLARGTCVIVVRLAFAR